MKKDEIQLPEGLSQEKYDALKKNYGDLIHILEAETNKKGDTKLVIVKSPENDRKVCGQFERFIDTNPDKAREILVVNCVLHDEKWVLENNFAFRSVSRALVEMIPMAKAALKN